MQTNEKDAQGGRDIRVAVIPVAGKGTRWKPITRSVPKELLPVWRRTSASYAFEEAVAAGFDEIIFVISPDKLGVFEHFLRFDASDLSAHFIDQSWADLHERVKVRACIQEQQLGLGHAILCAEQDVNGRPFAVLLPDEVLMQNGLKTLVSKTPAVLLMEVPFEQRANYGIVKCEKLPSGDLRIDDLVEKPAPELAPSSYAITGRYTFTPEIFDHLRNLPPGHHGEIQLTDAMKTYTQIHPITGVLFDGTRHDVGQPMGLLTASLDFALRDPQYKDAVRDYVKKLIEAQ